MGNKMIPIPYGKILRELENPAPFGISRTFRGSVPPIFGPAAGPHTQMAQNIVAGYLSGARFFELKTVQIIDGDDLPVSKPCIRAADEGYNCEWSTELTAEQAREEYIKAYNACKRLNLGDFELNISVGYDLAGIKSPKIDGFLEAMRPYAQGVTLSTLHGCPAREIERIAEYLIADKGYDTHIKLNPTLLGYARAREILDAHGFGYISFGTRHFENDLQPADAFSMIRRLKKFAAERGKKFGVKLTNTFPVRVENNELPADEMYMSGRALLPLSLSAALLIAKETDVNISYSGGADFFNIAEIIQTGIAPVTMATTLLKPGGYARLRQIAEKLQNITVPPQVRAEKIEKLLESIAGDPRYKKPVKPIKSRNTIPGKPPERDCFAAPCESGCPISQDITEYTKLVGEGKYADALRVIAEKNPLPFITGTICPHNCMQKCVRNYYDTPVNIRKLKLTAAENGFSEFLEREKPGSTGIKKVAVIGGGAAGLSCAYFLRKLGGADVTVFEKEQDFGGIVRYVIPEFRIGSDAIDNDLAIIRHSGAKLVGGAEKTVAELKNDYDCVVVATGATQHADIGLDGAINAIDFLRGYKSGAIKTLGRDVIVIGGGNTAMDAARAAKRVAENVTIVYRRTAREMPADEEEFLLTLGDGVKFIEKLVPVSYKNGELICGDRKFAADAVITATGERAPEFIPEPNVFVIGDAKNGPATVVEAIRDARSVAERILNLAPSTPLRQAQTPAPRGILRDEQPRDDERCLRCGDYCGLCVEVCPNRANIEKDGQILHIQSLCNECGCCAEFCPYEDGEPYKDKLQLEVF